MKNGKVEDEDHEKRVTSAAVRDREGMSGIICFVARLMKDYLLNLF